MEETTYKQCLDACNLCISTCLNCADACLNEQEVKMMAGCIRLDLDCAAICQTVVQFISVKSKHSKDVIKLCASICQACADECGKHDTDHCKKCADICQQCADVCKAA
jgi:hypothetical protein